MYYFSLSESDPYTIKFFHRSLHLKKVNSRAMFFFTMDRSCLMLKSSTITVLMNQVACVLLYKAEAVTVKTLQLKAENQLMNQK